MTRLDTAYENIIDHLRESEREVTGLIFVPKDYLVYELHETVLVMLLDSLEAVDADRIVTLIEHSEYMFVALLPEDAATLDENYQRITDI